MLFYHENRKQETSIDGEHTQLRKNNSPTTSRPSANPDRFGAQFCGDVWRPEEDDKQMKLVDEGFDCEMISDALPERTWDIVVHVVTTYRRKSWTIPKRET